MVYSFCLFISNDKQLPQLLLAGGHYPNNPQHVQYPYIDTYSNQSNTWPVLTFTLMVIIFIQTQNQPMLFQQTYYICI